MNPFKRRPVLICSLLCYTLLLSATLLYLRFPAKEFKLFCEAQLVQILPGSQCSIGTIRYTFPLTLTLSPIIFSEGPENDAPLYTIQRATVHPDLTAPGSLFQVGLKAYGGSHSFTLARDRARQGFRLLKIQLNNLDLAKIPLLQQGLGRTISGSLSGTGHYQASWKDGQLSHRAQGKLHLTTGHLGLLLPILSLKDIDLSNLETDIVLQERRIVLSNGQFQGKELNGYFAGDLLIGNPWKHSELALHGSLEPLPPLLKKSRYAKNMVLQLKKQQNRSTLPFLLQGNIQRPRFKFDS